MILHQSFSFCKALSIRTIRLRPITASEWPPLVVHLTELESLGLAPQDFSQILFAPRRYAQFNQTQSGIDGSDHANAFIGLDNKSQQVDVGGRDDEVLPDTRLRTFLQGFPLLFHQRLWYQMNRPEGKGDPLC